MPEVPSCQKFDTVNSSNRDVSRVSRFRVRNRMPIKQKVSKGLRIPTTFNQRKTLDY